MTKYTRLYWCDKPANMSVHETIEISSFGKPTESNSHRIHRFRGREIRLYLAQGWTVLQNFLGESKLNFAFEIHDSTWKELSSPSFIPDLNSSPWVSVKYDFMFLGVISWNFHLVLLNKIIMDRHLYIMLTGIEIKIFTVIRYWKSPWIGKH